MNKKFGLLCAVLSSLFMFSGCATGMYGGLLYTNIKTPSTILHAPIDQNAAPLKSAEGSCVNVLGLISTGDASIAAITQKNGIKRIHHVDTQYTNVLGLFSKTTFTVYGE